LVFIFGFVGGAKRCPYPSIDFVLRGIKLSSWIFTSYNPLFTATMSGPAPAQTDATPGVQFDDAAAIAEGRPPSRSEFDALVEQMTSLMAVTKDMQCRVVELLDHSCKVIVGNPGTAGNLLDAALTKNSWVKRVVTLPNALQSLEPPSAGGPELGGSEGQLDAPNSTLHQLSAEAERLLAQAQRGTLDLSGGPARSEVQPQAPHVLANSFAGQGLLFPPPTTLPPPSKALAAILIEHFGLNSNVGIGGQPDLHFAIDAASGTLRHSPSIGSRSFLSDNKLFQEVPDMAVYVLANAHVRASLLVRGDMSTTTAPAYDFHHEQMLRLYTQNFGTRGHLQFLKFDRTLRVSQHVQKTPCEHLATQGVPQLMAFTLEVPSSSPPAMRTGSRASHLPAPRGAAYCYQFADSGHCNRGEACPYKETHACSYCDAPDNITHGSNQCLAQTTGL
jgi:hypothetical protein